MDPRCRVCLVLAQMDYSHYNSNSNHSSSSKHSLHTVVIVPTSQVQFLRPLTVFGYDDAPHGHAHLLLHNIHLSQDHIIHGEGKGFEIAQARLGPGRVHHCMRAIGLTSRCYQLMLSRVCQRHTFGKPLHEHGMIQHDISQCKIDLECARLLTLECARAIDDAIDNAGDGGGSVHRARDQIALIKIAVPNLCIRVVDRAVQVFGGAGVDCDSILARSLASLRTLRIADGPDAVHRRTLARLEVKKVQHYLKSKSKGHNIDHTADDHHDKRRSKL